jgi:predicted PurR-regulated permease PerM/methylmalonyl-CoA mutase cobalamin-binding subunit
MMQPPKSKTTAADALVGIWAILLTSFVIGVLYFARELLIPIALAALLSFLLSPLATRIERWIGRVAAVLILVTIIFVMIGGIGWILTRQMVDLATRLPDYKVNIATKLHAFRVPTGGTFSRLTKTIDELKKDLPGTTDAPAAPASNTMPGTPPSATTPPPAVPVELVGNSGAGPTELVRMIVAPILGPLGTTGLVLLLVIFMLLKREDLLGRLIRLMGQGRISETTRVMDDAGRRVSRYLLMQFIINVCFGVLVAAGLSLLGLPNALLWGALAGTLRFIPYIGSWIGAAIPIALSIAVSASWLTPLLTLGLFLVLELINANVVEPWVYGSTTGVSAIALIVAAVFWAWLWGPVGLVLATPLTVCLVVMGRHIPKLEFLSVLLSDEQALEPNQEFYHRLLVMNQDEASHLAEVFLKTHSLTELYDAVVLPALSAADLDLLRESIDSLQHATLQRDVREIVEELGVRPTTDAKSKSDVDSAAYPALPCHVLCLPARAERDELAGAMLAQLLRERNFEVANAGAKLVTGELIELVDKSEVDAVCISVVPPSNVVQARYLCTKLRARFPQLKILIGLWGSEEEPPEALQRLRSAGADEIVTSLATAVSQLEKYAPAAPPMVAITLPADEEERLAELMRMNLMDTEPEKDFDKLTQKLARIFDVSIALITFVDRDRQFFKSHFGLPQQLSAARSTSRADSICAHVVGNNAVLVVEDLARDPRFAHNLLLRQHKFRFYAGVPLHSPNGQPIGSLCVLDLKPRQVSERERRLLQVMGEEVNELLSRRAVRAPAPAEDEADDKAESQKAAPAPL